MAKNSLIIQGNLFLLIFILARTVSFSGGSDRHMTAAIDFDVQINRIYQDRSRVKDNFNKTRPIPKISKVPVEKLIARDQRDQDIRCPKTIKGPLCICSQLQSQKIGLFCNKADFSNDVINALNVLILENVLIDIVKIINTPIPILNFDVFKTLQIHRLILRNNSIIQISRLFKGRIPQIIEDLEELEISGNEMNEFPMAGIAAFKELKRLDLSGNRFSHIPDYTFLRYRSRDMLEELDLSANNLSNEQLHAETFLGLEALKKISLDKNQLKLVPTLALKELAPSLEELSLAVNQITRIEPGSLPLPRLKSLSLDVNRINRMDIDVFRETPSLLYLYLSNNAFTEIQQQMFIYIKQLKVLSMNGNPISQLDVKTFRTIPSLLRLELSNCLISEIQDGTFDFLPKIQFITLAQNKMRKINQSLFASALRFLISLDLSRNLLSEIEDFAFSGLPQLQSLDLESNQIEHLNPNTFYNSFKQNFPQWFGSRILNLRNNPLKCDYRSVWLIKWLNANKDIQISSAGNPPTSCASPIQLKGVAIQSSKLLAWFNGEISEAQSTTTMKITTTNAQKSLHKLELQAPTTTITSVESGEFRNAKFVHKQRESTSHVYMVKAKKELNSEKGLVPVEVAPAGTVNNSTAMIILVIAFIIMGLVSVALLFVRIYMTILKNESRGRFSISCHYDDPKSPSLNGALEMTNLGQGFKFPGPLFSLLPVTVPPAQLCKVPASKNPPVIGAFRYIPNSSPKVFAKNRKLLFPPSIASIYATPQPFCAQSQLPQCDPGFSNVQNSVHYTRKTQPHPPQRGVLNRVGNSEGSQSEIQRDYFWF